MTPEDIAKLPYRRNVGVMLVNREGHAFVGQRIDTEMPAWQMPQGGIDKGEDPQTAALRELEEETGIGAHLVDRLIADGIAIPPTVTRENIPDHLRACLDADGPLLVSDVSRRGLGATSGSGRIGRPSSIRTIVSRQISAGRPPPVTPLSGVLSS